MNATTNAGRPLKAPRAAAVAGILFSALLSTTLLLIWSVIPVEHSTDVPSLQQGEGTIDLALSLVPFAAVAYLWFIGVVLDQLGEYEDKLSGTGIIMALCVVFGSGVHRLFVLVFPAWVLLMSVVILITNLRIPHAAADEGA